MWHLISTSPPFLFFFFPPSGMICAYPFGQFFESLVLKSKWVTQGSDFKFESRINGFITTMHWSVRKKSDSTASFVPNDIEATGAKRRNHNLSFQAFPSSIDQNPHVLAIREGRCLSSASPAPSAPAWRCCGTWHSCADEWITSSSSSVSTD